MSVVFQNKEVILLDTEDYLQRSYKSSGMKHLQDFYLIYHQFFSANSSTDDSLSHNKKGKLSKRKRRWTEDEEDLHCFLDKCVNTLKQEGLSAGLFKDSIPPDNDLKDNKKAKLAAEKCLSTKLTDASYDISKSSGDIKIPEYFHSLFQNTDSWKEIMCLEETYIIPPNAAFIMSDIRTCPPLLSMCPPTFDFIVIDPPWENKSVKRRKNYCTLDEHELLGLPVRKLIKSGGLVAVWCTCSPKQQDSFTDSLVQAWNLCPMATWYWIKLTRTGSPVLNMRNTFRRPYELLFLAKSRSSGQHDCSQPPLQRPPSRKVFASIPSSVHSSKPPLTDMLANYLPPKPKCLELFARNLHPNWTSWGNEPLKLQHKDLFQTL